MNNVLRWTIKLRKLLKWQDQEIGDKTVVDGVTRLESFRRVPLLS